MPVSNLALRLLLALIPWCALSSAPSLGLCTSPAQDDEELEALLLDERQEADRLRRRGEFSAARRLLSEHLRDDEEDGWSRLLLARVYFDEAKWERAEKHAAQVVEEASDPALAHEGRRLLAELGMTLGRYVEVERELIGELLAAKAYVSARDFLIAGDLQRILGDRPGAEQLLRTGAGHESKDDWRELVASALCRQRLGRIEDAGKRLVAADRLARQGEGEEPDILVAMGELYFEADREVAEGASRSAAKMYDDALALNSSHEGALLGLYQLHRVNYHRHRRSAHQFLTRARDLRPDSIESHLAVASNHLRVGRLPAVRQTLEHLDHLAPNRREVRTLHAALAWVEHDREGCEAILAELSDSPFPDSEPLRVVGRHLLDLYRFAEALPFLERAVEADSSDYDAWTMLGQARANVGDEAGALEALRRSRTEGGLRQDAWRKNTRLVLERLEREYQVEDFGELSFAWRPDAAAVLAVYFVPFYQDAREELAGRYGFTPEPTHIEVFRRHGDFSVRSTGFEGFPALGVCFGPVVTALSPISELRGSFSWARTSFHEFTHVIHLGLSHNRCPRWITEGLATWEEAQKNPAWARNLRRELVDAEANGQVIPVRDLNAAFRGPRIIFGYYEGGLICEMLIGRYGFPPMIRLLEAFDAGLDLDQVLGQVYGLTPEELDAALAALVLEKTSGLAIEPHWDPQVLKRLRLGLRSDLPEDPEARSAWQDGWTTQAIGAWQDGRRVDAEEALRQVRRAGDEPPRALFLRAEMEMLEGQPRRAMELWKAGIAAGGEDYQARISLGLLEMGQKNYDEAEEHFLAAEAAFPGFDDADHAAELKLVGLYIDTGRRDDAMRAAERYLVYDAGSYTWRRRVAAWHAEEERWERAAFLLHEANEVDPFTRSLHLEWATALRHLGRWEEALREYEVVSMVPVELDSETDTPLDPDELADLYGQRVLCLIELGRLEEAAGLLEEGEALETSTKLLEEARERLEAAG